MNYLRAQSCLLVFSTARLYSRSAGAARYSIHLKSALIVSLPSAISVMLEGGGGTPSFVIFCILTITAVFSGMMLYKVTHNYFNGRKTS